MKILLDVDGVVADTMGHLFELMELSEEKIKRIRSWNVFKDMDEEDAKRGREIMNTPRFWETLPLVDGAKRGVRELKYLGNRITWLTSPYDSCPDWGGIRNSWIRKHFGGDPVIIEKDKEKIDGKILIDDKPDNISKWSKAHPVGIAILFDTQFNRDFHWNLRADWSGMTRLFVP